MPGDARRPPDDYLLPCVFCRRPDPGGQNPGHDSGDPPGQVWLPSISERRVQDSPGGEINPLPITPNTQDPSRLYYNKSELQQFEDIECEWPVFLCLLLLDALYARNNEAADHYWQRLDEVLVIGEHGVRYIPELYKVDIQNVAGEKADRGSQPRSPAGAT